MGALPNLHRYPVGTLFVGQSWSPEQFFGSLFTIIELGLVASWRDTWSGIHGSYPNRIVRVVRDVPNRSRSSCTRRIS